MKLATVLIGAMSVFAAGTAFAAQFERLPEDEAVTPEIVDRKRELRGPAKAFFKFQGREALCEGGTLPQAKQVEIQKAIDAALADGSAKSEGEAIFNLTLDSAAYSCARCHTNGWSYGNPLVSGGGALGPNLTAGGEVRQFPNTEDNLSFVQAPPEQGKKYGQQGQSTGRMPAFGSYYNAEQLAALITYIRSL